MGDGGIVLGIVLLILAICIIAAIVNNSKGEDTKPTPPIKRTPSGGGASKTDTIKSKNGLPELKKIYSFNLSTTKTVCRFCGAEKGGGMTRCPVCGEK